MPSPSYSFSHRRPTAAQTTLPAQGVTDFLRAHDKLGMLLPAAARLAELQKACNAALPGLFDACFVLHFNAGELLIAAPNAAFAAKLRQQLPKLQNILTKQHWQVNAIRLKVQVGKITEKSSTSKQLVMPERAIFAFTELDNALEATPRNACLKEALQTMMRRHAKR